MRDNYRIMGTPLSERIKKRLDVVKMSARAASLAANMSGDAIRNILRGRSEEPGAQTLSKLAAPLRCRVEWLISGKGPETDDISGLTADECELLEAYRALSANKSAALAVVQSLVMTERRGDGPPHSAGQSPAPKAG